MKDASKISNDYVFPYLILFLVKLKDRDLDISNWNYFWKKRDVTFYGQGMFINFMKNASKISNDYVFPYLILFLLKLKDRDLDISNWKYFWIKKGCYILLTGNVYKFLTIFDKTTYIEQYYLKIKISMLFKGTFLSKDTDIFVISPKRRTFYFPEL